MSLSVDAWFFVVAIICGVALFVALLRSKFGKRAAKRENDD
jgi:hypothetical protein